MNKLRQAIFASCIIATMLSCNSNKNSDTTDNMSNPVDTTSHPYKATYSSNIVASSHPEYLQTVLTIWKMFETKQIEAMKKYYADTVTYEDASGYRFYGKSDSLLDFARKDIEGLDSLRFDISLWQNVHIADKNEDWVYIWSAERRYSKNGKADTSLIHEQWKLVNGKVAYFNQYSKKPSK